MKGVTFVCTCHRCVQDREEALPCTVFLENRFYLLLNSIVFQSKFWIFGQRTNKENGFQKVCQVFQDCISCGGGQVLRQDMAQGLFQVPRMWHDPKHEELQRI